MFDLRTLGLGVVVFFATFAVGWWSGIGKLATASAPQPAAVAPPPPSAPAAAPSKPATDKVAALPQGKGLTDDDRIRKPVLILAKAYLTPTCGDDLKGNYVRAASRYAEVLMRAAGCSKLPTCAMGASQLERVWLANRSAADLEVAQAMAAVHAAGGLSEKSFRGEIGRTVRVIAGVGFKAGPGPQCTTSSRGRRNRVIVALPTSSSSAPSPCKGAKCAERQPRKSSVRLRRR